MPLVIMEKTAFPMQPNLWIISPLCLLQDVVAIITKSVLTRYQTSAQIREIVLTPP